MRRSSKAQARSSVSSSTIIDINDPLDAAGRFPNPLTGLPYSSARMAWARKWREFPLYKMKDKLQALVGSFQRNSVTIVVSGTGSGKTLLAVPLMLRKAAGSAVAVTIPKRTAVLAAAQTGAEILDVELGQQVGYKFRGANRSSRSKSTVLLYATDGTLLAQARHDPLLSEYGAVVVDEAHERPVPTDLLLASIRPALSARPEMRLAVMSATIDPTQFVRYFEAAGLSVGVITIAGSPMHAIERRFVPGSFNNPAKTVEAGLAIVKTLITDPKGEGNIIMFVPLTNNTKAGCKVLDLPKDPEPQCVSLYGKMSANAREAAVVTGQPRFRRVFVATNVAESSITIANVRHVVDSGLQMVSEWNARWHATFLRIEMASKAQITQRIGRAGRTAPGTAHLLYSAAQLAGTPEYPKAAILMVDLSETLLYELVVSPEHGPVWFMDSLITPPSVDQIVDAVSFLHLHGLINATNLAHEHEHEHEHDKEVPYKSMPYASIRYSSKSKSKSESKSKGKSKSKSKSESKSDGNHPDDKVTSILRGCLVSHAFKVTAFGKMTAIVMERLRLSLQNALLVLAGMVHGCTDDANVLGQILEVASGDWGSLWKNHQAPMLEVVIGEAAASDVSVVMSDHVALVSIFRKHADLDLDTSHTLLLGAGLAPHAWLSIRDALRSVARGETVEGLEKQFRLTCPNMFIKRKSKSTLRDAVVAARTFNTASVRHTESGGTSVTTLNTLMTVSASVDPIIRRMNKKKKGGVCVVFEQMSGSRGSVSCVTYTPSRYS